MRLTLRSLFTASTLGMVFFSLAPVDQARADLIVSFSGASTIIGSGTPPTQTGIYATADFSYVSAHVVDVALSVTSTVPGLAIDNIAFEFASNYASSSTTASTISGPTFSASFSGSPNLKLNGSGNEQFNSLFDFGGNGGKVDASDPAKFSITFDTNSNLTPDLSGLLVGGSDSGNFYAGAHLTSYTINNAGKSVALAGIVTTTAVPEPSTLISGGTGAVLLAIGAAWRRRRTRA